MIKSEKTLLVYAIVGLVFGAVLLVFGQPMGWLLLVGGLGQFGFIFFLKRKRQEAEAANVVPASSMAPGAPVAQTAAADAGTDATDSPDAPTPR
ncbi:hypothetical protein FRIG_07240 [Frigoribacterium faeni]|uniref:hypothetical protein n=1 Tax=Frigoribacterium faeni TaxID=145483 RepID=UPI001FAE69A0|nr:hypothetical protein [Frigoribacterium faeni]MCJ0700925.1 hypothetical protein [Frigoribacterium faeni]